MRSLADDPAMLSLLAVRPDERDVDTVPTPASADQPALRDRIVAAIKASPFDELRTVDHAPNGPLQITVKVDDLADVLLRRLPPPADRAAVLREEAARIRAHCPDHLDSESAEGAWMACHCAVADDMERRMAVEAQQQTEMQPRRGDQSEAWLKTQRDEYEVESSPQWAALDEVLDTYRLHADTGTPLSGHVCEGKVAGDCERLEQPAVVAAVAGEEPAGEWCKCRSCWGWFVEDHPGEDLDELGKDLGWWAGLPVHRNAPAGVSQPGKEN